MRRRIAVAVAMLLLLIQAVPVLACVASPSQPLVVCCCDLGHGCATGYRSNRGCDTSDSCYCVQAVGSTPALSGAAAHPDDRAFAPTDGPGGAPVADALVFVEQSETLTAARRLHIRSARPPIAPSG